MSLGAAGKRVPAPLGDDSVDDFAVDVGEAEIAAGVLVGEALVIEAEEVEDGGVQVVEVDLLVH